MKRCAAEKIFFCKSGRAVESYPRSGPISCGFVAWTPSRHERTTALFTFNRDRRADIFHSVFEKLS